MGIVGTVYWLITTAIYLAWSFGCNAWDRTWILWPVAGVLFAVVITFTRIFASPKNM